MNPSHLEAKTESIWHEIEPLLDEGLSQLSESDRLAIILRYFQRQSAGEMGQSLGISEGAAKMRLARAIDKLRVFFERRGVVVPAAILGALLSEQAVQAIPAAFLQTLTTSIAPPLASGAVSSSVITQILIAMTKSKIKTAVLLGVLVLGGFAVVDLLTEASDDGTSQSKTASGGPGGHNSTAGQKSWVQGLFDRRASRKVESAALTRLREIIASTDLDYRLPPIESYGLIKQLEATQRRAAFDLVMQALESPNWRVECRAASMLQYFPEFAAEAVPKVIALLKVEKNEGVNRSLASSIDWKTARRDTMETLAETLQSNPAAAMGIGFWFNALVKQYPENEASVLAILPPLLRSADPKVQFYAADVLARLPTQPQASAIVALLPALKIVPGYAETYNDMTIFALWDLKKLGSQARSAAEDVIALSETPQGKYLRDQILDTLAAIAPDLRSEIPELDAKLRAQENAAALEHRATTSQVTIEELTDSLNNREARMKSVSRLAELGADATSALPRLREVLAAGGSDSDPNANNFLYDVAMAIKKIDPTAPNYYRPEDLHGAYFQLMSYLETDETTRKNPQLGWPAMENRFESPKPFDTAEIISILNKLNSVDPVLREVFVSTFRKSAGFVATLDQTDPKLAKVLAVIP